ncbi:MAG: endonuclease/exonuclease/phosphatase family protein [Chloroflexi bacterium]|nr:endonuclease/exonuclease/phosphatase family protein [Chloroflexota bacterium]
MKLPRLWNTKSFFELALPALTTLFALQMLRVLLPSFVWYLGDSVGLSYALLGIIAVGTFALSFLVIPFYHALGLQRALTAVLVGIAICRLGEQLLSLPLLDFVFSLVGTVLYTFFIPLYLIYVRIQGGFAPRKFGRGFLLGFVFDTTLHGSFHTLDLNWQSIPLATIIVVATVIAQLWLTLRLPHVEGEPTETNFIGVLPLVALGPFIFVTEVVFQNIARATTLTGFPMPLAYAFIILVNAIGITAALLPIKPDRETSFGVVVATGFLAFLTSRPDPAPGTADLLFFFGNLVMFPFVTLIFAGLGFHQERNQSMTRFAVANGIGWLLFAILTLMYYISYDITIGIPNTWLPPIAVVMIGLAVLQALRDMPQRPSAPSTTSATVAFALLIVPIIILANWHDPKTVAGKGLPVRVMTYNVHAGFDTNGQLNPEAIAQTIEKVNPDIIGLQEVERGWYIDSSVDLLMWLSRRLGMPYVFGPTADRLWGNAILSRYPIKQWGNVPLPPRDLKLKRGFTWARIDVGNGDEVFFIATHYHHIENDTEIRQQQSPEIVKFWNQQPRTIFMGDLNASPDAKEIGMLRDAGLKDAFALIGTGEGLSWPSDNPNQRIDYIWVSSDLNVRDLQMPTSTASDHLGVAVTVDKK